MIKKRKAHDGKDIKCTIRGQQKCVMRARCSEECGEDGSPVTSFPSTSNV